MNELVMIVEDDDDLRHIVAMFVAAQGFRTVEASDGLDALTRLEEMQPALILLDIRMPRMNGVEFLHAVRDTPAARIPVIALTGDAGAANDALEAGAITCLRKPVEPRAVVDSIRSHIGAQLAPGAP